MSEVTPAPLPVMDGESAAIGWLIAATPFGVSLYAIHAMVGHRVATRGADGTWVPCADGATLPVPALIEINPPAAVWDVIPTAEVMAFTDRESAEDFGTTRRI